MHRREFFQQAGAVLGAASLAALAGPDQGDEPGKPAAKGPSLPGDRPGRSETDSGGEPDSHDGTGISG